MRPDDVRRAALALAADERAELAAELLVSVEAPTDANRAVIDSLWEAEIERRARRVIGGDAELQDWDVVRQRLANTLGG